MILNRPGSSGPFEQSLIVIGPGELGRGLGLLVEQMAREGDIALGGSIKLEVPPIQGKNNRHSAQSLELMLNHETLYIERFKLGSEKTVETITGGGEQYPRRSLRILNQFEIRSLILNFNKYAEQHAAPWIKLADLPQELRLLPDLVAMIAEGARFPAIRKQITTLEDELRDSIHGRGGDRSISMEERRARERFRALAREDWLRYRPEVQDPDRVIPRHYVNNWRARYAEGNATFGKNGWQRM